MYQKYAQAQYSTFTNIIEILKANRKYSFQKFKSKFLVLIHFIHYI